MPNVYQANIGNKYPVIIPRNWVKFGLKIDEVQAKIYQIWVKKNFFVKIKIKFHFRINGQYHIMVHYLMLHYQWLNIDKFVYLVIYFPMEQN